MASLTWRPPADLHEQVRTYAFYTGRSINDVLNDLVRDFMAGPGRDQLMTALSERGRDEHRAALDALAASPDRAEP